MNPRTIIGLALAAALAAAVGCARPKDFSATGPGAPPELRPPLDKRIRIRAEAASWKELVATVRPTCTWNGCDLLWAKVGVASSGRLSFVLDRAFVVRPKEGPPKWALIECAAVVGPLPDGLGGASLRTEVILGKPIEEHDAGPNDFVVEESRGPNGEVLYRLGWQSLNCGGSSNFQGDRRIFVLRDAAGRWSVAGEGIEEGRGHCGYPHCYDIHAEYRVRWTGNQRDPVRVEISEISSDAEVGEQPRGALDLETRRDGVLVTNPQYGIRWTDKGYVLAGDGDSLRKIAARLSWWEPADFPEENRRREAEAAWLEALRKLNPKLPDGQLAKGTRVEVMPSGEFAEMLRKQRPGR